MARRQRTSTLVDPWMPNATYLPFTDAEARRERTSTLVHEIQSLDDPELSNITVKARQRVKSRLKMRALRERRAVLYRALAERNGGEKCAICGLDAAGPVSPQGKRHRLYLDHDHSTGFVRDLLCHSCNTGIGHFRDNPQLLRIAIAYILWHSANPSGITHQSVVEAATEGAKPLDLDMDRPPAGLELLTVPGLDRLLEVEPTAVIEAEPGIERTQVVTHESESVARAGRSPLGGGTEA